MPAGEPFDNECCADMVEIKTWRTAHEGRHEAIDTLLDRVLNRVPLWVTALFTVGGVLVGSLITIIGFLLKVV